MSALSELAGTYAIDASHSRLGFAVRHAAISKTRGHFEDVTGTIEAAGENTTASLTAEVVSIDTGNEQRDGHLRTNDFFDAENHPQITFTSTAVKILDEDTLEVTGDLTIKGTTHSVTVPFEFGGAATDPFGNERIGFEGKLVINRKDYGVSWNAPLEAGGVLVGEKVSLELEIEAVKQA